MNKDRLNRLAEVASTIEDAVDQIQDLADEEQEAIDNLPDSLRESERATKMEEAVLDMGDLIDRLCRFEDHLDHVIAKYSATKRNKQ